MMSKQIFFVTSYPRSRTAWLATLLTWGDSFCFHDGLANIESLDELDEKFDSVPGNIVGNSDPANLLFQEALMERYSGAKWIEIIRPIKDCERSWRKLRGPTLDWNDLQRRMMAAQFDVHITFDGLNDADTVGRLADYLCISMPRRRIEELMRLNIQILPKLAQVSNETVEKMNRLKASLNECVLA